MYEWNADDTEVIITALHDPESCIGFIRTNGRYSAQGHCTEGGRARQQDIVAAADKRQEVLLQHCRVVDNLNIQK